MNMPSSELQFAALSDTGLTRSENQDFAYAGPLPGDESWHLFAVADGVGGHARGEWASQRTIELVAGGLAHLLSYLAPDEAFEAAVMTANETVKREAIGIGAAGAATTFVAALVKDGQAWWANVGDSRIYLLGEDGLRQLSDDHSWVAEQVRAGQLSAEDARTHGRRNVVTRTVGFDAYVRADTGGPVSLGSGGTLLICSDGLHGRVEEKRLAATIAELDPRFAVTRLVELANEAGGPDNITAVVVRLGNAATAPVAATNIIDTVENEPPRSGRKKRWIFSIALGALIVAGAAVTAALLLL